jgi:hypothetical protein
MAAPDHGNARSALRWTTSARKSAAAFTPRTVHGPARTGRKRPGIGGRGLREAVARPGARLVLGEPSPADDLALVVAFNLHERRERGAGLEQPPDEPDRYRICSGRRPRTAAERRPAVVGDCLDVGTCSRRDSTTGRCPLDAAAASNDQSRRSRSGSACAAPRLTSHFTVSIWPPSTAQYSGVRPRSFRASRSDPMLSNLHRSMTRVERLQAAGWTMERIPGIQVMARRRTGNRRSRYAIREYGVSR